MNYLFTLLLLIGFTFAKAQSADETAVLGAEKARFDAQVSKQYDALGQLLADDLVYTHSNGVVDTKQSFVQSIRDGKSNYKRIDVQEQKARVYGNTAIVNGVCAVQLEGANGQLTDMKLRYTDAYVKRGGRWQLVTWQSLRLNP